MPSVQPGPTSATVEPATATPPHVVSEFVRVVRARARTVVAIAVVVAAAVMIGWMLWPTKYKAVALVALDPQAPRLVADQASGGGNGDASTVASYAEVATSDGFLIPIAKEQKLVDDPEFAGGGDGIGDALIELRRNLKVTRRGLTYLIDVSFSSKDPDKAARVANAVADEIVRRQQTLRREANTGLSDALRSRLADLRAAVLASEKAVADYRQKNDLLDVSPDGRVGLKRLNSLTEQIGPIRARLEDARARWDKLRKVKSVEDADPSIFRSDRLTELLSRLGEEKRQMASATQTFGPRHPSVEAAQARIASIETAIRDERARIVDQVKAEVDVLTEQNAAYEKEIAKRTGEQLAADQKEVVLQDLVRQAQADRQIYEQFLARQKTTQEQGDMSQPEAVVVSSAAPPTRPTRPGLTLAALVGLLGGLGTGLMWVLFGPPPARRAAPLVEPPSAPIAPPNDPVPPAPLPAAPAPAPSAEPPASPPPAVEPIVVATEASPPVAPLVSASAATPVAPSVPPPAVVEAPIVAARTDPMPLEPAEPPAASPVPLAPSPAEQVAEPPVPVVDAPEIDEPAVFAPTPTPEPVATEPPLPSLAPTPETPAPETSAPETSTAALRPSPRRHDPAQRLKRMLRTLTERDVPLVADLTRADHPDAEAGLTAFVETIAAHLDRAPGLVLTVVGEPAAPVGVAEALAAAIEARGHSATVGDAASVQAPDLVVEAIATSAEPPMVGAHPFVLLVVEASRTAEEGLAGLIDLWESDPERVLVAAFVPPAAVG